MNEMSKCNTAQSPPTLECVTFSFAAGLTLTKGLLYIGQQKYKQSSGMPKAIYGGGINDTA